MPLGTIGSEVMLMKLKSPWEVLFRFLSGVLFSTLISFSALGCLMTAFSLHLPPVNHSFYLPCDLEQLLWYALGFSILASICYTGRFGPVVLLGLVCFLGYQWHFGPLRESMLDFLYIISKRYDGAYQCGVLLLKGEHPLNSNLMPTFRAFSAIAAASISWTVCRRQSVYWVCVFCLLCLAPFCVMTNTVPDTWLLLLWAMIFALFLLTQWARHSSFKDGLSLTLLYTLPILAAIVILFALVPKESYNGKSRADALLDEFEQLFDFSGTSSDGSGTRSKERVDLSTLSDRKNRRVPVMYLTAPTDDVYYLRGQAYSQYTGTEWIAQNEIPRLPWANGKATAQQLHIRTRFEHEIQYIPYCAPPEILTQGDMGLANIESAKEYSYVCYDSYPNLYTSFEYGMIAPWTGLPTDCYEWAKDLVDGLMLAEFGSSYFPANYNDEVSDLIVNYVRNSAEYDLSPEKMDPTYSDFAQWFIEEADRGYCVHFASTTAVLLRAAGIPARYVTGYMVEAKANQETTVYQKNAHAWVEYWTVKGGWNILDPTPSQEEETAPITLPTETTTKPTLPPTTTPTTAPTEPFSTMPSSIDPDAIEQGAGERQNYKLFWHIFKWFILTGLIVFALWGQRVIRLNRRQRKLLEGDINIRALFAWNLSLKYAKALKKKPDNKLKKLAEKAKFSQHSLTAQELNAFNTYFSDAKENLKSSSWYQKLYHRLILVLY